MISGTGVGKSSTQGEIRNRIRGNEYAKLDWGYEQEQILDKVRSGVGAMISQN